MFCPVCKAEYREGFTRCSSCDLELVPSLDAVDTERHPSAESLETIWRGGDPVELSRVVALLREEDISYYTKATHDHLVFQLAMPKPLYEVLVFQSDLRRAQEVIREVVEAEPHEEGQP